MESKGTVGQYRMCVIGAISDHVAEALGSAIEPGRDGSVLVGEYVDQAHLTGLINRLYDLRIPIRSVEIVEEES
ncbi:MAG: hypothetical protein ACR2OI_12925 [Acidimicrobiia bacterium]